MLAIVLAFIIAFIGWVVINWLAGLVPNDYAYVKLMVVFIINILYGIFIGKYIGRRLLYFYLKRIYKDKETEQ